MDATHVYIQLPNSICFGMPFSTMQTVPNATGIKGLLPSFSIKVLKGKDDVCKSVNDVPGFKTQVPHCSNK